MLLPFSTCGAFMNNANSRFSSLTHFFPNIFAHFKKITTFDDTSHFVGPSSKVRSLNAAHTIAVWIFLKNTALPLKYIHLHALM